MQGIARSPSTICARCLRVRTKAPNRAAAAAAGTARFQSTDAAKDVNPAPQEQQNGTSKQEETEGGAMSRRLEEMTSENMQTGGRSARKAVEESGFSEELKARLQEKIATSSFRSDNASAFAQAELPNAAGRQTRDIAGAQPWMGSESLIDTSSRMLQDAHKPLRVKGGGGRGPGVRLPGRVDTGRPSGGAKTGVRLANARDKTSYYETMKGESMSEEERAKYRQELKDRFSSGGRIAPASIQGLTSLANERIEDAIARGQFKNLPRGQKIERDHNASNPFLDTTEYFMNKMIQRQDIVPPWIEKQQEVVATATRFRAQLRASWRRHVSRTIASRGGSLERQLEYARALARAESLYNPQGKKVEKINTVTEEGQVSQITLAGELKATPPGDPAALENEIQILEQILNDDGSLKSPEQRTTVTTDAPGAMPLESPPETEEKEKNALPAVSPFRDPAWEQTERSYHKVAIENLNTLNRSYNLMAPAIAQKPYFNLDRELKACFADVAPQVADAIKERALAPKVKRAESTGHRPGSVLDNFSTSATKRVYDETKPQYGFKQFWSDLFAKDKRG